MTLNLLSSEKLMDRGADVAKKRLFSLSTKIPKNIDINHKSTKIYKSCSTYNYVLRMRSTVRLIYHFHQKHRSILRIYTETSIKLGFQREQIRVSAAKQTKAKCKEKINSSFRLETTHSKRRNQNYHIFQRKNQNWKHTTTRKLKLIKVQIDVVYQAEIEEISIQETYGAAAPSERDVVEEVTIRHCVRNSDSVTEQEKEEII